ncbi:MAG: hypothetical protein ACTSXG_03550 [Alphaproteobacteria bacterium]
MVRNIFLFVSFIQFSVCFGMDSLNQEEIEQKGIKKLSTIAKELNIPEPEWKNNQVLKNIIDDSEEPIFDDIFGKGIIIKEPDNQEEEFFIDNLFDEQQFEQQIHNDKLLLKEGNDNDLIQKKIPSPNIFERQQSKQQMNDLFDQKEEIKNENAGEIKKLSGIAEELNIPKTEWKNSEILKNIKSDYLKTGEVIFDDIFTNGILGAQQYNFQMLDFDNLSIDDYVTPKLSDIAKKLGIFEKKYADNFEVLMEIKHKYLKSGDPLFDDIFGDGLMKESEKQQLKQMQQMERTQKLSENKQDFTQYKQIYAFLPKNSSVHSTGAFVKGNYPTMVRLFNTYVHPINPNISLQEIEKGIETFLLKSQTKEYEKGFFPINIDHKHIKTALGKIKGYVSKPKQQVVKQQPLKRVVTRKVNGKMTRQVITMPQQTSKIIKNSLVDSETGLSILETFSAAYSIAKNDEELMGYLCASLEENILTKGGCQPGFTERFAMLIRTFLILNTGDF